MVYIEKIELLFKFGVQMGFDQRVLGINECQTNGLAYKDAIEYFIGTPSFPSRDRVYTGMIMSTSSPLQSVIGNYIGERQIF